MNTPKKSPDQPDAAAPEPATAPENSPSSEPATEPHATHTSGGDYEPYPGAAYFHGGRTSDVIAVMAQRLNQEGFSDYRLGADWTNSHRRAFKTFQESLRPKGGGDTSGIPDEAAWNKLRVPRVTPEA
ncbi:hypothetical protein HZZ00_37590 (plasmid) [Streptomyces sp. NEAU-sy36]|uniref:hypothetical protein n=1 Tax=unclassified Streptomyces TaxID=2593676 RepID=UPI0015D584F5|nr:MULTISPECIES: hypothetical protein [unclassified Streptomyces]QLJ06749.1 hypothetical protein HZZ00_37590 [Streptomyces sp. NEAU-sy36]